MNEEKKKHKIIQILKLKRFVVEYSGYIAPEYAMHGYLSVKADVFSFGILVLEIVSGRKVSDKSDLLTDVSQNFSTILYKVTNQPSTIDYFKK
uniref:Serine-threonine/tyrosine-protein kinase catalytic domain-containing protein n=1 Tax=Lactuca sativa TaxID=4236 RepID=A0A9R1UT16_LACSA|nr:hypothetical protein LSAT_V11C800446890 [Lactuca sativa]